MWGDDAINRLFLMCGQSSLKLTTDYLSKGWIINGRENGINRLNFWGIYCFSFHLPCSSSLEMQSKTQA